MATTAPYSTHSNSHPLPVWQPCIWLRDGWRDLWSHPGASLAYGALVAVLGGLLLAYQRHPLFIATATLGFLLVGPAFAAGLCELSRWRALGRRVTFDTSLQVLARCREPLRRFALMLLALAALWFAVSLAALSWTQVDIAPTLASTVWGDVLRQLSPVQLLVYAGIALVTAIGGFALTVISVPLIIEREVSATTAMRCSAAATWHHLPVMLVWASLVGMLVLVGFATWLLGLIVIFPLLGHATWRAYEDLRP